MVAAACRHRWAMGKILEPGAARRVQARWPTGRGRRPASTVGHG